MKGEAIIVAENLTKKFNGITAVNNVSIQIRKGEIFGLLGPNGAGKTTFISMLATLLRPNRGKAFVNGYDAARESHRVRECIGLVFQESILDLDLTGYDNLDFHARLYGIAKKEMEVRIKVVSSLVGLEKDLYRKVTTFSGGMKRRLEIARGMLHHPQVLFLDEPTLGLDPQTRRKVWEYIKHMKENEGVTVLLTTHYMEEADYLCDRVAIIDNGRIVALGTPQQLKGKAKGRKPTLEDAFLSYTGREIRDEV